MVDKLDAGETFDDEIMALYASIQATREVIAAARDEINANRPAAEEVPSCPVCGAELAEHAKFCANCGAKVEEPSPQVVEAEVVPSVCPQCGAELEPKARFCIQCGAKVETGPAPEESAE